MKAKTQTGAIVAVSIVLLYALSYLVLRPLAAPGVHEFRISRVTFRVETAPSSELPEFSKRMADLVYALPLAIDRWTMKSDASFADHTVWFYTEAGFQFKGGSKP